MTQFELKAELAIPSGSLQRSKNREDAVDFCAYLLLPAFDRTPRICKGRHVFLETRLSVVLLMITKDMPWDFNDNGGRRSGFVRRTFSYSAHIPERRDGKDRRSGQDRRKPLASNGPAHPAKMAEERRVALRECL
jgi:hypothetical protein